jgi:hypothetical protein
VCVCECLCVCKAAIVHFQVFITSTPYPIDHRFLIVDSLVVVLYAHFYVILFLIQESVASRKRLDVCVLALVALTGSDSVLNSYQQSCFSACCLLLGLVLAGKYRAEAISMTGGVPKTNAKFPPFTLHSQKLLKNVVI